LKVDKQTIGVVNLAGTVGNGAVEVENDARVRRVTVVANAGQRRETTETVPEIGRR